VALLGVIHLLWLVKAIEAEQLAYLAIILGLLATRIRWPALPRRA